MKRTQFKDALRNIWKQKVAYLSVIVIALLGVTTFLGINYSDGALRINGSIMYNQVNFRDIEIVSSLLLSEADLESILGTEGVADAEPVWQTGAKVSSGEIRESVNVISLTERINLPQLVEGRLPETVGECAVEERLAVEMGWHTGDEIETLNARGEAADNLKNSRFVITGIANHPDHTSTSIPDTMYVMVQKDAFDLEALDSCFMKAEVVVDKPAGIDRFTKKYDAAVAPVLERLENEAEENGLRRASEIKRRMKARLEEEQSELDDAKAQLEDARRQLDDGWKELKNGEQKLADNERQLKESKEKLDRGEDELWAARLSLAEARAQLEEKRPTLEQTGNALRLARAGLDDERAEVYYPIDQAGMQITELTGQINQLNARLKEDLGAEETEKVRKQLAVAQEKLASAEKTLEDLQAENSDRLKEYEESEKEYANAYKDYQKGADEFSAAEEKIDKAQADYKAGLNQWYILRDEYEKGLELLKSGRDELEESRKKLDDGEADYSGKLADWEKAAKELTDALAALDDPLSGRWLFFDCRGNSSFVQLLLGSSNLVSLEMSFSLLFVLVGALVIYATISKMIDEQRNLVGAGKALGLYNREVFAKYLLFGLSSTLIGTALGILAARFGMEAYVLQSAKPYYTFDTSKPTLILKPTVIVIAAGLLLSVAATWFACKKLLRSTAIELMQPRVPFTRKKAGKSSEHIRQLYPRLILRNIRSDLGRVIVTIVSVAGCCALVVIGFTLKSAVEGALENQYSRIVQYDARIKYDTEAAENAGEEIRRLLRQEGIDSTELYDGVVTFRVTENLVGELLCGDLGEIGSYYRLLDWKTGEALTPTDEGVFIQKRTAESYGLDVGSELELTLADSKTATARVAGVFDNYIGRNMLVSPACYQELFDSEPAPNAFFIRLNGADDEALQESLRQIDGFESYTRSDADRRLFASSSSLVTAVVALFIFMAAVMAGVVLTNLTNTYILQKKMELTIMRINGFTVREVIGYVSRETVITTIVGILLGIAAGAGMAYQITRAMESVFIQYDRSVNPLAWALGAAITGIFALLINVFVLRKVRDLKLTDAT